MMNSGVPATARDSAFCTLRSAFCLLPSAFWRNDSKHPSMHIWPATVLVCLVGGCAIHSGTEQRHGEASPRRPAMTDLSASVRRLPPVSDSGTQLQDSRIVPAVFRPEPGGAASHVQSAQAIPAEWRQWPGSVVKTSQQEPTGERVVGNSLVQLGKPSLQVEFVPADPPAAEPTGPEPMPVPEPTKPATVTLRCDDVDVRKALEMLSNEASVNILVASGVTGKVTANLQGLSFDEALGAILKLCNLVAQRQNDLVFVYPLADVPQLTRSLRAFPLDYVSAADAMLGVQGLLSPSGKAFVMQSSPDDNRKMQNMIVAEDVPDYLLRVEQYLAEIDRPPRQVLIEVHVLEIELEEKNKHGVNFEHTINVLKNTANLELHGFANPLASQAFFVNVDGANLEALVECLKTTTDAKTLASPRVLVLNGQKARIQIGEQLGYRVITTTETSSMQDVKFLDLGVVLTVAPHISRDNQVVMRVKPKVSSGQVNPETDLPEEETTEVETDVLLMDGQGMVIGGLIQEKDSNVQSKIPLLGDIWLIGRLFQHRELVKSRSEIVITLIPRVLPYQPDYEAQDQFDTARAAAPLFHGPLCRYPRPWEPSLPDTDCRLRDLRCGPACR